MGARAALYGAGVFPSRAMPAPSVAVGNLTVGGSGKTPIAGWIANHYAGMGLKPAILLRGYGGDEGDVLRADAPEALVLEDPDRWKMAQRAVEKGVDVLVLDDAFQRLDVRNDLNIVLVSAESQRAVRWTLPVGPWREGWKALQRADLAIVTRKRADLTVARATARRVAEELRGRPVAIAHLRLGGFSELKSGRPVDPESLDRARVVVAAGVADPGALGEQLAGLGARVEVLPLADHQRYDSGQVNRLVELTGRVDYVVVTKKDAVKLARQWPDGRKEPLVARLEVDWEAGREDVVRALDAVVEDVRPERGLPPSGRMKT
jgi:tetraacyldisaccharide 4'-kinase